MTEDLLTYLKAGWQMVADRYHIHVYAYVAPPGTSRVGYLAFSKQQSHLGSAVAHMFPATPAPMPNHGSIALASKETGP